MCRRLDYAVKGFIDDNIMKGTIINNVPVIGGIEGLDEFADESVLLAFGSPEVKERLDLKLSAVSHIKICDALIDPAALLMNDSTIEIGKGSVVTAGCILTTDIYVGKHVLINLNTTIGHDSTVGDYSSIMPGCNIAGSVRIGRGVFVGTGSTILNGVSVGDGCLIGAGSVVNKNVEPGLKVLGVPAREWSR